MTPTKIAICGLLIAAMLAACSTPSASSTPSLSVAATPESAAAEECHPLDLRVPSGEPLDLSGSWQGDDLAPYEMRQFGDCLWWVGNNPVFTYLGFVHLKPDFTLAGEWATISASDVTQAGVPSRASDWIGAGTITLALEMSDEGTNATVRIVKTGFTNAPGFEPTYDIHVASWHKVDDTPDHPVPAPSP